MKRTESKVNEAKQETGREGQEQWEEWGETATAQAARRA